MDSGITRALILAAVGLTALTAVFISTGGVEVVLLNGEELEGLQIISSSAGPRVPLKEAARFFGARVDPGRDGGFLVEWGKGDSFFLRSDQLSESGGRYFVNLGVLVESLEGNVNFRGRVANVTISPARLVSASPRTEAVSLNFDNYSAFTRLSSEEGETIFRFFNATKGEVDKAINMPSDDRGIESAHIRKQDNGQLVLRLKHREGFVPMVKTDRGNFGFRFTLELREKERDQVTPTFPPDPGAVREFSYQSMNLWSSGNRHTLHYLKVSQWRDNFRLEPVLAGSRVGKSSRLYELVRDNLGVAGLNANFFDPGTNIPIGLIIKDGRLLSRDWGSRAAVGIDSFGRLEFFRPDIDLFLRTSSEDIPIAGLNRPIGENELVVYTPEYGNSLTSRFPATFLKLRDGEVVSSLSSPPVSVSSGETLIAATGSERGRLRGLVSGDEAEFDWNMEPNVPFLRAAVSAGPLLVQGGRNVLDLEKENFTRDGSLVRSPATRSVLATTRDDDLLFIVISEGGIGLEELPGLLLKSGLNIDNAIAFDGGSSSGMVYRDGLSFESVGGSRQVPVGLALIPRSS